MQNPSTHSLNITFGNKCKLYLFVQDEKRIQAIAEECDSILSWLGAPSGFTVYLWLIDWPRFLKADEWATRKNVNGGWAIPGINEIFVYRDEEWDRVLIHETIHALKWDWEMPETPLPCWGFDTNDTLFPHLFEAWTELYAEWLWIGWHKLSWEKQRERQDMQALQVLARNNSEQWKTF